MIEMSENEYTPIFDRFVVNLYKTHRDSITLITDNETLVNDAIIGAMNKLSTKLLLGVSNDFSEIHDLCDVVVVSDHQQVDETKTDISFSLDDKTTGDMFSDLVSCATNEYAFGIKNKVFEKAKQLAESSGSVLEFVFTEDSLTTDDAEPLLHHIEQQVLHITSNTGLQPSDVWVVMSPMELTILSIGGFITTDTKGENTNQWWAGNTPSGATVYVNPYWGDDHDLVFGCRGNMFDEEKPSDSNDLITVTTAVPIYADVETMMGLDYSKVDLYSKLRIAHGPNSHKYYGTISMNGTKE